MSIRFDHLSFAVHDAIAWGRRLRRVLGATPIGGEVMPEFRFLITHLGTATTGGRIEVMEPNGPGFLTRFLDRQGEGAHHITFTVPSLRTTVDDVRDLGLTVVKEDYGHAPWQEAFIYPDARHNVVIQLAQSDRAYPDPATLVGTRERDVDSFPTARGATERTWWLRVWEAEAGAVASVVRTDLAVTDPAFSDVLFGGVLGGEATTLDGHVEYRWPGGVLALRQAEVSGVERVGLSGVDAALTIGPVVLSSTRAGTTLS